MSGWRSPMASASSPLAETPHTAVRSAGNATSNRDCAHRRTSSTRNFSCAATRAGSNAKAPVLSPCEYSCSRRVSSSGRCAPMIIVGGASAASSRRPHDVINWPSPANTTASGGAAGTYAVTCRPPSYSNLSVTSWPAVRDIGVGSLTAGELHLACDDPLVENGTTRAALDPDHDERFLSLRRALGVTSFGINQMILQPGQRMRIHRHRRQEEGYLVLEGVLTVAMDGEETKLASGELMRVAPEVRRQLINYGPDRVLL